jgi:lipid-binding SYLF domain-containing protein
MQLKYSTIAVASFAFSTFNYFDNHALAQSTSRDKKIIEDANNAKLEFIKADPLLDNIFNKAYAYVIFPNIGKGGFGVGGATGNGAVYEGGSIVGLAKMTQLTLGFQAGGQAYREVIFFESKKELDNFKQNNLAFAAQASAIIATEGASGDVKYDNGIMIFTHPKGGLMYEASVGGQKFSFRRLK